MFLGVEGLARRFGSERALAGVSFAVDAGQIVSIIGPSGAGKTTLLKIIAGLERADEGRVAFETEPTREKPVILVFQDFLLFPNMTVYDNAAFGLAARRVPAAQAGQRVMEVLDFFGLADRRGSYPHQLSAGQKQRVAIARAMVVDPLLLLLDEPFANLDRNLKMSTAEFLRETQRTFGVTTIAVTHDLEEAFVMSDRVGLMLGGRLVQYDTASELYVNPVSREAAEFLGPMNEIGRELFPLLEMPEDAQAGSRVLVRPECVGLAVDEAGTGTVREAVFAGHFTKYRVAVNDTEILAYGQFGSVKPGERVRVRVRRCLKQ